VRRVPEGDSELTSSAVGAFQDCLLGNAFITDNPISFCLCLPWDLSERPHVGYLRGRLTFVIGYTRGYFVVDVLNGRRTIL
jgi:hypothetical protein